MDEIDGPAAVHERVADLVRQARSECLLVTSDMSIARTFAGAVTDGQIRLRVVCTGREIARMHRRPGPERVLDQLATWIDAVDTLGGEVRVVASVHSGMLVIDRNIACVMIDPRMSSESAVQFWCQGVVSALVALGDQIWAEAQPWAAWAQEAERRPTPQEQQLLRLLAAGFTDSAVSSRLGLSPRTVRRMMADLTERLEVRGRFAVGVQSVRRGWI